MTPVIYLNAFRTSGNHILKRTLKHLLRSILGMLPASVSTRSTTARVLKWFLDPNESHCQGIRLLRCLFEVMGEQWIDEADTTRVRREVSEGDSRFDIVIESRSVFACIEVKIRAQESREQLVRYFERVDKKIRGRRFVGRLLTVDGKSGEPVVERFTRLLWSDVACALRRFCGAEYGSDPLTPRSLLIRELASQYADFITSHF
jgi:hypothetical protein